jgi:hypothetical protein
MSSSWISFRKIPCASSISFICCMFDCSSIEKSHLNSTCLISPLFLDLYTETRRLEVLSRFLFRCFILFFHPFVVYSYAFPFCRLLRILWVFSLFFILFLDGILSVSLFYWITSFAILSWLERHDACKVIDSFTRISRPSSLLFDLLLLFSHLDEYVIHGCQLFYRIDPHHRIPLFSFLEFSFANCSLIFF